MTIVVTLYDMVKSPKLYLKSKGKNMPLIQKIKAEIETLKGVKVEKRILDEVHRYCEHFKVTLNDFVNQGFEHILKKDVDWKKVNKKPQKEKANKEE